MDWLVARRRIRGDTIIASELFWFGRRVDLVTLTISGVLTAYELKLRNNKRAVQQASYNRLSFDRSYVVTASKPKAEITNHAKQAGVGVIVMTAGDSDVVCEAKIGAEIQSLRHRLVKKVRQQAEIDVQSGL